jgi:hypothetical protein
MSTKKVTHTKTTYNFLQEHSDQAPHVVKPLKAQARGTNHESGVKARFDDENVSIHRLLNNYRQSYQDLQRREMPRETNSQHQSSSMRQ